MSIKTKVGIAFSIVIVVILTLTTLGMSQATTYYWTVDEFLEKSNELNGNPVKVSGKIVGDSVKWDPQSMELRFEARGESGKTISIYYEGLKPDNFINDWEVIAEGVLNENGVLVASQLLIKCPSKYEAAEEDVPSYE